MAKRHSREPLKEEEKRSLNKTNINRLRQVFRFLRPYRGLFIFGLISLALSSFTVMAFPRLSGELLDAATGNPKFFRSVDEVAIAMIAVLFVQAIFSFIRV
jgi:ABC-type multidrug transport system fused ATPase/permease subunit